jgi:ABC-type transport system substrate-binding protein
VALGTNGRAKYGEDPRVRSYASKTINSLEVNTNHKDPVMDSILSDPDFRKAIFYAIDRNAIAKVVEGIAAPYHLSTVGQVGGAVYRELPGAKALVEKWAPNGNGGYDPTKAKSMMDAVLLKNGKDKVTLQLVYTETSDNLRIASEYIDAQFDTIFGGKVDIELRATPSSAKNDLLRSSWKSGPVDTWELGWAGWGLAAEDFYPWKKFEKYMTTNSSRYSAYENTKLDEIYEQCLLDENRLDGKKLQDLTVAGESAWYDDMTNIPVYSAINQYMYQERIVLPMNVYTSQTGFGWPYCQLAQ